MTATELLRSARDLESQGHLAEADRLRWLAASVSSGSVSTPALTGEDSAEFAPPCRLAAALREAEAVGDLAAVARLSPVLERLAG